MEKSIDILINTLINAYQGIIVTYILVQCLGYKEKIGKKQAYIMGTFAIFILLEIQLFITYFEGFAAFILLGICFVFSLMYLEGTIVQKILYNAIVFAILTFAAVAAGTFIGSIANMGYIDLVSKTSWVKYASMLVNQILLFIIAKLFVNAINRRRMGESNRYTLLATLLLVISATTLIMLIKLVDSKGSDMFIYVCGVVLGIILLAVTSLVIYSLAEKSYSEKLQQELELRAYKSQKHDVEEIKRSVKEIQMVRHEMNNVLSTISNLLQNSKYDEAKEFTNQFKNEEVENLKKIQYTDNIVLNHLLNRKIDECNQEGIDIKCVINGSITGIKDIDLHCIFSNLLDNAIEAVKDILDKSIAVSVFGNEHSIFIEVTNAIKDTPNFISTKEDKKMHGYGIQNVKNVVSKYNGQIEYKQKMEGYLTCQVIILKEFTTKNGNSRQIY